MDVILHRDKFSLFDITSILYIRYNIFFLLDIKSISLLDIPYFSSMIEKPNELIFLSPYHLEADSYDL